MSNMVKHGQVMRGMDAAPDPPVDARFGRMFPGLDAAVFSDESLAVLAASGNMVATFDAPKDGPDPEESGIPAIYTYFGQFVDHDLTFGPEGSFAKQKDIDATEDFRTPAFDLDNIYGRGPIDQPYLYDEDGMTLLLGDPILLGTPEGARDLQRNGKGRALIGDPRNDENAIVSQLQGIFIKFHNRVVAEHAHTPGFTFEHAQAIVRAHYQHVVLYDFLPRIVTASVLDALKTDGKYDPTKLKFFTGFNRPFMPLEFSVAAYRFGHSMVRPGYRLNDSVLLPIFPLPAAEVPGFPEGLTGFRHLITDWALDWGRFAPLDIREYGQDPGDFTDDGKIVPPDIAVKNFNRLQLAYKIDTSLVDPLGSLPASVAGNMPFSLALRNLQRGVQMGLPSGQAVAQAMIEKGVDVPILKDAEIQIGKADGEKTVGIADISPEFAGKCPLWTYVLAEAMHHVLHVPAPVTGGPGKISTPQLGPVGGRIVAEVFLGLYFAEKGKVTQSNQKRAVRKLNPIPQAEDPLAGYTLTDFIKYAFGL